MSWKKNVAGFVGILVVCVFLLVPVAGSGAYSVQKGAIGQQDQIVFSAWPENGIYWNTHKIANYSVPYFLHYHFRPRIPVSISISGNLSYIDRVVLYINGAQQFISYEPPYQWKCLLPVPPHGHSLAIMIVAYTVDGGVYSCNQTVYRLFL